MFRFKITKGLVAILEEAWIISLIAQYLNLIFQVDYPFFIC